MTDSANTESCADTGGHRDRTWTCRLTIVHPPEAAMMVELGPTPVVLGRLAGTANIHAVSHRTVSRQHVEVAWDRALGRHYARDLHSRNGTWLAGQPLSEIPRVLEDNAALRFGDVIGIYERQPGTVDDTVAVDRLAVPGQALTMIRLRSALARAATDPAPVLLIGESGVGKEHIAAEVHRLSARRGPLLPVNCAALSPQLIDSQLFGHERGAFTGATSSHRGLFRAATGGSLFLDEIGELPLHLQPKLLRVLEQGEVLPLGSTTPIRVDVRVIAATNRALDHEVAAGQFRRDLYARLALWQLEIPRLAHRRVDILAWLERLTHRWAHERKRQPLAIPLNPAVAELLVRQRWTENLRGVLRLVHELADRTSHAPLAPDDLPSWLTEPHAATPTPVEASPSLRPRPSREELQAALVNHGWNISATARYYDRDRKQVSRWIAMYALDEPSP